MNILKLLVVVLIAGLTQACVGPRSAEVVPTPAAEVGRYTAEVLENDYIARIIAKTSCDGDGLQNASSQIEIQDASRRVTGIRTRQNSECTKFGGDIIPSRGVVRNQGGGQHGQ